jgi:outer membrane protein assembly factor BamD (BamD/ComL family)
VSLASGTPRATTSNAATGSSLAEQNNLYARAIAAMRHATAAKSRSDAHEALAAFDQLMAKYPSGPLAESAAVERMRLLHVTDPARAVSAARLYLNSYPNGQARAEAEGIVAGSP